MAKVDELMPAVGATLEQPALRARSAADLYALIMLMAVPHDAFARIGRCSMGSLTPSESNLLLEAARRILPPHAEPVVTNLCGSTSAEITTQKILDHPGRSHWWVANCRRESREWTCGRIGMQEVEKRLTIGGATLEVAMTFDEGTVPEAVGPVATRALGMYADPDSQLSFCGGRQDPANRWITHRKEHPLRAGRVRVHVTAQRYADRGSVLLDDVIPPDDFKFEIQLPIVGPDKQDPRPQNKATPGQKCGISGTSTVAVDCRTIASVPIAVEPPCWMAMAP